MNDLVERLRNLAEVFGGKCELDCSEAAAEIERLQAELAALKSQEPVSNEVLVTCIVGVIHKNMSIPIYPREARAAAVEIVESYLHPTPTDRDAEDARRYRWLRDRPNYVVTPTFKRGNINGVSIKPYGCSEYYQHKTLEEAIDFAVQEGK